jgi:Domain of unknown function (DUF222)
MCSTSSFVGEGPGVLAFLDVVEKALDDYAEAPAYVLSDDQCEETIGRFQRFLARCAGMNLGVVRDADSRSLARRVGARTVADVLRGRHRVHPAKAREQVRVAAALDGELADTKAALLAGEVSYEHAAVIVTTIAGLHADVPADSRKQAEAVLLEAALTLDPQQLGKLGRHLQATVNPDPDDDDQLRRAKRTLWMRERADGMTDLHAVLDPEGAALAAAALDPLAKPQPAAEGRPDPRPAGRRYADALVEIFRKVLTSGNLPTRNGTRPHVHVHVSYDTLVGLGHQPGASEHGHLPLPKSVVDRLCCDSSVRRILFGPAGEPLDVGRAARTVTPAIRAAVVARDRLCTFPGCDRPPSWCEAHHLIYWNDGGNTTVNDCVLLCGQHHNNPHYENWEGRLGPDGIVEWRPPPWIDPDQHWQTNHLRQARDPYTDNADEPP